jgi:hypothetical protein
MKYGLLSL